MCILTRRDDVFRNFVCLQSRIRTFIFRANMDDRRYGQDDGTTEFQEIIALPSIEILKEYVAHKLEELRPIHLSYWGCDEKRHRIFFADELCDDLTFAAEDLRVINYGDGFLGFALNTKQVQFCSADSPLFIARDFINSHNIRQLCAVPICSSGVCSGIFFLASRKDFRSDVEPMRLQYILRIVATRYSMLRANQFQALLRSINDSSTPADTGTFLSQIDAPVCEYYRAKVFSVWLLKRDKLVCVHASDKRLVGRDYMPGEGATGGVFLRKQPVLAHRLRDLAEQGIEWKGKHTSIGSNPQNHAIFVPLIASNEIETTAASGIIRIVSYHNSNSFWPDDVESARTLAGILVLRFRNDALISRLSNDKTRLQALLDFSNYVSERGVESTIAARSFDSAINIVSSKINEIALLKERNDGTGGFESVYDSGFGERQLSELLSTKDPLRDETPSTSRISENVLLQRFAQSRRSSSPLAGKFVLITEFKSSVDRDEIPFLEILGNILRVNWENEELTQERHEILRTWERAEAAMRGGLIARDFAHEIKNQLRAITNWISTAQKSSQVPNFESLSGPIDKLKQFSEQLLQGSNFHYEARHIYLNDIVQEALRIYGVTKSGMRISGHTINLDLASELSPKAKSAFTVNIDPGAFISVFRNLMTNSIEQYAVHGQHGKNIDVVTRIVSGHEIHGSAAVLIVRDYAGGVNPELRLSIFEPFVSGKRGGSGMGLYSVREIVHGRMIGEIVEEGTFGKGAVFKITLPAFEVDHNKLK